MGKKKQDYVTQKKAHGRRNFKKKIGHKIGNNPTTFGGSLSQKDCFEIENSIFYSRRPCLENKEGRILPKYVADKNVTLYYKLTVYIT